MLIETEHIHVQSFTGCVPILLRIFASLATGDIGVSCTSLHREIPVESPPPFSTSGLTKLLEALYDRFWQSNETFLQTEMITHFIDVQVERLAGSESLDE